MSSPSTCSKSSHGSSHHHDPTRVVPITRANKWADMDARFPKGVIKSGGGLREVSVVDCKSCRQLYLRSAYTFSREKETKNNSAIKERAKECLTGVKDRALLFKEFSAASLFSLLRRILACTSAAKVDRIAHVRHR